MPKKQSQKPHGSRKDQNAAADYLSEPVYASEGLYGIDPEPHSQSNSLRTKKKQ